MESSAGRTPGASPGDGTPRGAGHDYPLTFSVDYPDRSLNRLSTALRIFTIIPIGILAATVEGGSFGSNAGGAGVRYGGGGIGILVIPVLLMLLFRKKYPRWWYDWNLQLTRFTNRIAVYFALMDDRYPSTDQEQAVHLDFPYPDAEHDLSRGLPLVKWLLAIPHYIVLIFLTIGALLAAIFAWFAILVHRPLSARAVRLHRGRDPLAQPRRGLRAAHDHRPLPAIQPAGLTVADINPAEANAPRLGLSRFRGPTPDSPGRRWSAISLEVAEAEADAMGAEGRVAHATRAASNAPRI